MTGLLDLPSELLHGTSGGHGIFDYATRQDLKALRLVCRRINAISWPVFQYRCLTTIFIDMTTERLERLSSPAMLGKLGPFVREVVFVSGGADKDDDEENDKEDDEDVSPHSSEADEDIESNAGTCGSLSVQVIDQWDVDTVAEQLATILDAPPHCERITFEVESRRTKDARNDTRDDNTPHAEADTILGQRMGKWFMALWKALAITNAPPLSKLMLGRNQYGPWLPLPLHILQPASIERFIPCRPIYVDRLYLKLDGMQHNVDDDGLEAFLNLLPRLPSVFAVDFVDLMRLRAPQSAWDAVGAALDSIMRRTGWHSLAINAPTGLIRPSDILTLCKHDLGSLSTLKLQPLNIILNDLDDFDEFINSVKAMAKLPKFRVLQLAGAFGHHIEDVLHIHSDFCKEFDLNASDGEPLLLAWISELQALRDEQ